MAKKKEAASRLLKALGKTKKEQMDKLYPKVKSKGPYARKTKAPYLRGKVMGAGDLITRRAAVAGTKATKFTEPDKAAMASAIGAGATGYAIGKGWHKKLAGAVTPKKKETHREKAIRGAKELVKKQKKQKEKRKSHH